MNKRDSQLFKSLVEVAERYLRDYCDGKQNDDEKAKVALRVLSVYRRVLRVEGEREKIRAEWKKLMTSVVDLKKFAISQGEKPARNQKKGKAKKERQNRCQ